MPKMSFNSKELSRRMKKVEGATVKHARRFVFKRWSSFREARRHIAFWVLAIGVVIGASGLQILWYQQSYRTTAYANDGTYAEAVLGPIDTLNPIFASSNAEEAASELLFSRLLSYDDSGHLNYDLAESMVVSDDQRTYTVSLRPDVRWQDGTMIRSKDVVYTVDLLKNPATRSTITGWNDIQAIAVDDHTVEFRLPAVYAAFPHALNYLPILPERILRDVEPSALRENDFSTNPTGSGPFTVRFVQDIDPATDRKVIHLARNDTYFRGAPKLERFQLHVYDTTDAIMRALSTSEVNAATDISVTQANSVSKERYSVERRPINAGVYALFNTKQGVMSDANVRKALQVGTDTKKLREIVGQGTPELYLPFAEGQVSGELPAAPIVNKDESARLLDEAGWRMDGDVRKKDGTALRITMVTTKNADLERVLESLQQQWRELGVTITTSIVDPTDPAQNVVVNVLQKRNYDVLLYQLTIGGDPDVYAYWHSSQTGTNGFNFANYANGTADAALSSARTVTNKSLRDAKYVTFARQWLNDAPAIGLYQQTSQYVFTPSVHTESDDKKLISPVDRYSNVLYWTVGERVVHKTP